MGPADGYPSSDKCNRRTSAQSSTLITPPLWPRGVKVHSAPEGQCSLGIDTSSGTCCSKLSRLFGHLFASAGRAAADAAEALGSGPFRSIGVTNAPTMRPHGPRTRKRLGARGVHRASDLRFSVSTRGAPERIRTFNLLIRSQMLYPLSYGRRAHEGRPRGYMPPAGRPNPVRRREGGRRPRGHHLAVGHQHRTWPGLPGGGETGPRAETVGFEPTERVTPFTALAGPRTRPDYATSPRRASGYLSHSPPSKGPAAAHSRHCSYAHARSVRTRAAASPIAMQITTNTACTPDVTATWTSPLFSPTTVR